MNSLAVVYLEWKDSEADLSGWQAYKPQALDSAYSVGLLVDETEDHYVIAHSYDPENEEYNGLFKIPRAAVAKARTLCRVQTKTKK